MPNSRAWSKLMGIQPQYIVRGSFHCTTLGGCVPATNDVEAICQLIFILKDRSLNRAYIRVSLNISISADFISFLSQISKLVPLGLKNGRDLFSVTHPSDHHRIIWCMYSSARPPERFDPQSRRLDKIVRCHTLLPPTLEEVLTLIDCERPFG